MQITTEMLVFICVMISAAVSIIIYLNTIDKRVTVLESKGINKDEFYLKIEELKEAISCKIESEIGKCRENVCK
jgi:hypothetical protein